MTTSTLHAASKALDSLLAGTPSKSSSSKPRRKRTSSKKLLATVDINDLDPAARAQREAEEKKRIDEAVKQLMRGTKLKKDELEVRERILTMREEQTSKKTRKRKAAVDFFDDSD